MKNAASCAKKLTALLKKLGSSDPPVIPDAGDSVSVLIESFFMWETTTEKGQSAYERLVKGIVDYNDLRVSMPFEVAAMIGARFPKAQERCERLRATLRDIYRREHAVSLDRITELGKRDIKKYIDSLEGITPYVAGRVQLLCFGVHSIPVDEQLRQRLVEEGASDADQELGDLANWLARQIKADAALKAHFAFQKWIDAGKRTTRTSPGRKTGAKKTAGRAASKTGKRKTAAKTSS